MMISNLPVELQNKIFFYAAEHPCAKIIKSYRTPFIKYATIGTCERCRRHGRKLNLEILAECGDDVCISCNNYCPFPVDYCALTYLNDDSDTDIDNDFDDDTEDEDTEGASDLGSEDEVED